MSDLKSKLLTARFTTEDVPIDGVGVVKVRALSRAEVLEQRKALKGVKTEAEARDKAVDGDWELWAVSTAMVDPEMSREDVVAWQKASPANEIEMITEVIMRLSGIGKTKDPKTGTEDSAEKAAYKSVSE
jgi:hypothetical protein